MKSAATRPTTSTLAAAIVVVVSLALPNAVIADAVILVETTDSMHARYYSPNLGRFASVDPIGGSVGSSQSWNRYSYVLNTPLNLVDPTGMMDDRPNTMIAGDAFGKKPLMQPAQTPEGQRLDALFVSFYLSVGGSILTAPIGGILPTILLNGGWNLAGGATYRALDGDQSTSAFDRGSMVGDFSLGMLGGWAGIKLGPMVGAGGARVVSFGTSTLLPPAIDTAIDQAVSAMESSGLLDKMLGAVDSIPSPFVPANPNARDPGVNCHIPVQQQAGNSVPVSQMSMVEYLKVASE